jgi:hypothetical protein
VRPGSASAERRETTARDLHDRIGDPQAVEAKIRADASQAKPATEATRGAGARAPKARMSRGRGPQRRQQPRPQPLARLRVFGSYLDTRVDRLGDIDIALETLDRSPATRDPEALLDYRNRSGRTFSNFTARLTWPTTELVLLLRNRSGYINAHLEDISRFTNTWRQVYP